MTVQMLKVTSSGKNRKLGHGVCSTYRPLGRTCPPGCQMLGDCYGKRGHVFIQQKQALTDCHSLDKVDDRLYLRHCVTGDAFMDGELDRAYVQYLIDWHTAHPHTIGWTYTHDIEAWDAAGFTADTMPANLHVMASVDTEEQRQYAIAHGWRYARVEPDLDAKAGKGEVLCPFDVAKLRLHVDDIDVTCKACKLCFKGKKNVVFYLQKKGTPKKRK